MTVARFMGSTEPGARIENVTSGTRHSQFPYKPQGHLSRIGFRNFIARNLSRQLFRPGRGAQARAVVDHHLLGRMRVLWVGPAWAYDLAGCR